MWTARPRAPTCHWIRTEEVVCGVTETELGGSPGTEIHKGRNTDWRGARCCWGRPPTAWGPQADLRSLPCGRPAPTCAACARREGARSQRWEHPQTDPHRHAQSGRPPSSGCQRRLGAPAEPPRGPQGPAHPPWTRRIVCFFFEVLWSEQLLNRTNHQARPPCSWGSDERLSAGGHRPATFWVSVAALLCSPEGQGRLDLCLWPCPTLYNLEPSHRAQQALLNPLPLRPTSQHRELAFYSPCRDLPRPHTHQRPESHR